MYCHRLQIYILKNYENKHVTYLRYVFLVTGNGSIITKNQTAAIENVKRRLTPKRGKDDETAAAAHDT